jgi:hypothetical protein
MAVIKNKNKTINYNKRKLKCFRRGVLDTTLCDKVCQGLATGQWFSLGNLVSSTNKTDCHNITAILLKVVSAFS